MLNNSQLTQRSNTQFLTGIRGYAALGVVMVHCTAPFKGQSEYLDELLNFGKYGVVVFFVLSAFSLAISMQKSPPNNRANLLHYFNRRFWRIFPLYCAVCSFMAATMYSTQPEGSTHSIAWDLFMHLSFLNIFDHTYANSLIGVEWTIPLEMLAYLFLPILFYASKKQSWILGLITTIVLYIIGKQASAIEDLLPDGQTFFDSKFSLIKYFFAFYAGTWAYNRIPSTNFKFTAKTNDSIVYGLVIFLPLFAMFFQTSTRLIVIFWTIALIYALLGKTGSSRWIFENKLILHLGNISFSIYLLHMPIYFLIMPTLESNMGNKTAFALFIGILVTGATSTYLAIETPFVKLGEAIFKKYLKREQPTRTATC